PELGRPWDVTAGPDGFVYVVDGGDMNPKPPDRGRLLKLDRQGRVLETWSSFGKYDGQIYWGHAVAVGKNGDVYVTDVNVGMRVQKFVRKAGRERVRDIVVRRASILLLICPSLLLAEEPSKLSPAVREYVRVDAPVVALTDVRVS